jgi:hypothetical protein
MTPKIEAKRHRSSRLKNYMANWLVTRTFSTKIETLKIFFEILTIDCLMLLQLNKLTTAILSEGSSISNNLLSWMIAT